MKGALERMRVKHMGERIYKPKIRKGSRWNFVTIFVTFLEASNTTNLQEVRKISGIIGYYCRDV